MYIERKTMLLQVCILKQVVSGFGVVNGIWYNSNEFWPRCFTMWDDNFKDSFVNENALHNILLNGVFIALMYSGTSLYQNQFNRVWYVPWQWQLQAIDQTLNSQRTSMPCPHEQAHGWPSTQPGSLHTALQRKYTQPCLLFSRDTAVWTMGERLCEQWGTAVCKCPAV